MPDAPEPNAPPLSRRIRQGFPTYQDAERGGQGAQPPREAELTKNNDIHQPDEHGRPQDRPAAGSL